MKKILRYLSVKQLMEDIADLNGVMSVRRFVLSTMLAGVAVYGACLLYRINYIAALFVMILAVIMIPGLVRNYFMERSKASRFADVDVYLHQMTYSFIRNPKVNIALQDAYAISSGRLKRCLSRAIEELQYGMGERVYEDALKIVEEEYDCSRIRTLHKFLVSVEEKGGRYTGAMEVLLEDFDRWVNNVYKYQSEIRKIKRDITIGIMISMVLAMLTTVMCSTLNMFSKEPLSITDTLAYQCVSIVFVVLCMLFYIYTRKHYGCDWIGETRTDKQIMRDYNNVFKSEAKKITLKMIPLWGIMLLTVIILVLVQLKIAAICVAAVMFLFIITPFTQRKGSAGRIKNDLYCGFTEWLRDLISARFGPQRCRRSAYPSPYPRWFGQCRDDPLPGCRCRCRYRRCCLFCLCRRYEPAEHEHLLLCYERQRPSTGPQRRCHGRNVPLLGNGSSILQRRR